MHKHKTHGWRCRDRFVRRRAFLKAHPGGGHDEEKFDAAGGWFVRCTGDDGKKVGNDPTFVRPLRFVSHQVTGHRSLWGLPTRRGFLVARGLQTAQEA